MGADVDWYVSSRPSIGRTTVVRGTGRRRMTRGRRRPVPSAVVATLLVMLVAVAWFLLAPATGLVGGSITEAASAGTPE